MGQWAKRAIPPSNCKDGFTLIETLIALSIISVAVLTIIITLNHCIKTTAYLEAKTKAAYVAETSLNEAKISNMMPTTLNKKMFNQQWLVKMSSTPTDNAHIQKIQACVSQARQTLICLTDYRLIV